MTEYILKDLTDFITATGAKIPVTVIDTETTGFSPVNDCVVQFSGIKGYLNADGTISPEKCEVMDFYIRSLIPMPEAAGKVNGITDELLLEKGVKREDAYNRIRSFLKGSAIVGHNIKFDLKMLNGFFIQVNEHAGLINMDSPYICDTLSLARKVVHGPKEKKPCALSNLIKRIGADKDQFAFHNSLGDVYATAEVYNWLVRNFATE